MLSAIGGRPYGRAAVGAFLLVWILITFGMFGDRKDWYSTPKSVTNYDEPASSGDEFLGGEWSSPDDLPVGGHPEPEKPEQKLSKGSLVEDEPAIPAVIEAPKLKPKSSSVPASETKPTPMPEPAPNAIPDAEPSTAPPAAAKPEGASKGVANSKVPISLQLDVPVSVGCESLVQDLQLRLISEYRKLLKGIRYANIWGYLGET